MKISQRIYFPACLCTFFCGGLFFTSLAKAQENKENNYSYYKYTNLEKMKSVKEYDAKLTHFSYADIDLSDNLVKDCDEIFGEVKNVIPFESDYYFSISSMYCEQPANDQGQHIAKRIKINHLVESDGSELSAKELKTFLSKYKKYVIFDKGQAYYPVNHLEKIRTLKGVHSFEKLSTIVQGNFTTQVKNLEDYISERKTFFQNNIDLKDKSGFISKMNGLFGDTLSNKWGKYFNDPQVDVISLYTSGASVVVNTDNNGGKETYVTNNILDEIEFIDTRWDEFISEKTSSSSTAPFENFRSEQICVKIDTEHTDDPVYNNIASPVGNDKTYFYVYHDKVACFDFEKSYYLQHFLKAQGNEIWYGTTCRYLPFKRHEGKTLHYIGENGQYKCPVK